MRKVCVCVGGDGGLGGGGLGSDVRESWWQNGTCVRGGSVPGELILYCCPGDLEQGAMETFLA